MDVNTMMAFYQFSKKVAAMEADIESLKKALSQALDKVKALESTPEKQ